MTARPTPARPGAGAGLLLGWAADRALGDPRRGHPVAGFGRAMEWIERRIRRDGRGAGALYTAAGVAGAVGPVLLLDRAPGGAAGRRVGLLALTTWAALGGRSLAAAGDALAARVQSGDLDSARALAPVLVGRDPAGLDATGLCRAGIESVAENTADAVVGPLVYGALLGAPGVALFRAVNTMDAMVGHRSERYARFGSCSARADDLLGWPGARLAALLTVLLAPRVGGTRAAALKVLRRDGGAHPSPNAGRVEAAFAGALGVRLGGRNVYAGRTEDRPELGGGRAPVPADLCAAARLSRAVGTGAAVLAVAGALFTRRAAPVRRDHGGRRRAPAPPDRG